MVIEDDETDRDSEAEGDKAGEEAGEEAGDCPEPPELGKLLLFVR